MQGIFSLASAEEGRRDGAHRLLTHSSQPFALSACCMSTKAAIPVKTTRKRTAPAHGKKVGVAKEMSLLKLFWNASRFLVSAALAEVFLDISESNCHHVGLSPRQRIPPDAGTTEPPRWKCVWTPTKPNVLVLSRPKVEQLLSSAEVCSVASSSQNIRRLGRNRLALACSLT